MSGVTTTSRASYFARIDPTQYLLQGWKYAFRLVIPPGSEALVQRYVRGAVKAPVDRGMAPSFGDSNTILIPYLEDQDVSLVAATQVTYLDDGGKHIESQGRLKQSQTLAGTSGFLAAAPHPQNLLHRAQGQILSALAPFTNSRGDLTSKGLRSGYGWFHRMVYLLEAYWAIKGRDQGQLHQKVKFVYINQRDDQLWVIEPMSFRWRRSVQDKGRFTYNWSLGYEVIEEFVSSGLAFRTADNLSTLDPISEVRRARLGIEQGRNSLRAIQKISSDLVSKGIEEIIGFIEDGISIIDGVQEIGAGVVREATKIFTSIIDTGATIFDALDRLGLGYDSPLVRAFNDAHNSLVGSVARATEALNRMTAPRPWMKQDKAAVLSRGGSPRSSYLPADRADDRDQARSLISPLPVDVDPGDLGVTATGSGLPATVDRLATGAYLDPYLQDYDSLRIARVHDGDTIFDLALRELGDSRAWNAIVIANDLQYPYLVPRGADTGRAGRVLRYGDEVLVPTEGVRGGTLLDHYMALANPVQGRSPQYSGFADPGGSDVLRIRDAARTTAETKWVPGALRGYTCSVLTGTGALTQHQVRDNDEDTFSLSLEGTLRDAAGIGATEFVLNEGQGVKFPESGPLYLFYGTGSQVPLYLTSRDGDTLTFTPALAAPVARGATVYQVDKDLGFTPDATTEYYLWLNEVAPQSPPRMTPDVAFGLDFRLELQADGTWDMVQGPTGDADTVTGLAAYEQSLRVALDTRVGTNILAPDDGVPPIIGKRATPENLISYMMFVRRVVLQDPRAAEILSETIRVGEGGDIIGADVRVLTVQGLEATVGMGQHTLDFPQV